jgi:hypothetical protein
MNRLLLAGLLAGMSFAAAAQSQPEAPQQPQSNAIGTAIQPVVQDELQSEIPTRDVRDHSCLRETGSLVNTAQNQKTLREARRRNDINGTVEVKCAAYGGAYTQQDIRRTGATDLSEALRLLDPSIH